MSEREDIAAKRTACQNAIRALREALSTLDNLPQVGNILKVLCHEVPSAMQLKCCWLRCHDIAPRYSLSALRPGYPTCFIGNLEASNHISNDVAHHAHTAAEM